MFIICLDIQVIHFLGACKPTNISNIGGHHVYPLVNIPKATKNIAIFIVDVNIAIFIVDVPIKDGGSPWFSVWRDQRVVPGPPRHLGWDVHWLRSWHFWCAHRPARSAVPATTRRRRRGFPRPSTRFPTREGLGIDNLWGFIDFEGLGLMSQLLGICETHHQNSHICWKLQNCWVMWNIGTWKPTPV